MFGEKDLIFLGAVLIWSADTFVGNVDDAINQSKKLYSKIFTEDE